MAWKIDSSHSRVAFSVRHMMITNVHGEFKTVTGTVEFDEAQAHDDPDEGGIAPHRTGFDPARALADKELRKQILTALDKLSPAHRTVLVMREVEGLSYQEMADTMKCSIGTIMSRLFHARKKMQTMLIEYRKAANPAA